MEDYLIVIIFEHLIVQCLRLKVLSTQKLFANNPSRKACLMYLLCHVSNIKASRKILTRITLLAWYLQYTCIVIRNKNVGVPEEIQVFYPDLFTRSNELIYHFKWNSVQAAWKNTLLFNQILKTSTCDMKLASFTFRNSLELDFLYI